MDLKRVNNKDAALAPAKAFVAEKLDFWKSFRRKVAPYFCAFIVFLILFGVGISFAQWYIQIICIVLLLMLICACPMRTMVYFCLDDKYYETTIKDMDAYQDEDKMKECWDKAKNDDRWISEHDICDQVISGFCGFSTINSLLSAIYQQRLFLEYPPRTMPISLQQMRDILVNNVINDEAVKDEFPDTCLESIEVIVMNPNRITLADFENMIKEMHENKMIVDDDDTKWREMIYYGGNFSRQTLFFCNHKKLKSRFWNWFVGGHFSPIIDFCYDKNEDMYILVGDTNREKYGDWLVRSDRLYEAMKCVQYEGSPRGLLKIRVKRKINDDTAETTNAC